jgi:hypothetical protein
MGMAMQALPAAGLDPNGLNQESHLSLINYSTKSMIRQASGL